MVAAVVAGVAARSLLDQPMRSDVVSEPLSFHHCVLQLSSNAAETCRPTRLDHWLHRVLESEIRRDARSPGAPGESGPAVRHRHLTHPAGEAYEVRAALEPPLTCRPNHYLYLFHFHCSCTAPPLCGMPKPMPIPPRPLYPSTLCLQTPSHRSRQPDTRSYFATIHSSVVPPDVRSACRHIARPCPIYP